MNAPVQRAVRDVRRATIEFDPARPQVAIRHLASPLDPDVVLYYGAGGAPYVNVVDKHDMPVPAFGPIEVN
jgi:hypothetical protein